MPVVDDEIRPKLKGQHQFRGAFGIAVDNEHGTIWVTDSSSYSVAVYRQDTLDLVWTSHDSSKGLFNQDIKRPREVYVDEKTARHL